MKKETKEALGFGFWGWVKLWNDRKARKATRASLNKADRFNKLNK